MASQPDATPEPAASGAQAVPAVQPQPTGAVPGTVLARDQDPEEGSFVEEDFEQDFNLEDPENVPEMPPPLLLPGEVDDDDDEDQDDFEDGLESDGDFHADMDYDHPWDVASGSDFDYEYDEDFTIEADDALGQVAGSSDSSDDESPGSGMQATLPALKKERSNFLEAGGRRSHPCCTEANHHQTSDAVAISQAPFPSQPGSQQVVTTGRRCLQVFELLPMSAFPSATDGGPAESLSPTGQSRPAGHAQAAAPNHGSTASAAFQLRAEASNLPFQPYTLACTPDGRFIATGGSRGLMAVFRMTDALADQPKLEQIMLLQPGMDSHDTGPPAEEYPSFINCLRFGLVAGKQRLLAATQSGNVLLFDIPDPDTPTLTCSDFMATMLGSFRTGSRLEAHPLKVHQVAATQSQRHDGYFVERQQQLQTLAWGQSYSASAAWCPLNCAAASPNGLMVAAVGDFPRVLLLSAQDHFALQQAPRSSLMCFPRIHSTTVCAEHGSQYCVWHPDSVRLAVSSDTLRAVFVMDAVQRTTLMWFEDLRRPCMALAFPTSPLVGQSPILVFAENARNIYIADADTRGVLPPVQKLELPANSNPQPPQDFMFQVRQSNRRVTGLVISPQGELVVSMPDKVIVEQLLQEWSPSSQHRNFPRRLHAAAQTLLLVASRHGRKHAKDGKGTGLWSLPEAVVHQIIGLAAFPLGSWMNHRPTRPAQFFGKDDCRPDANFRARLEARKSAYAAQNPNSVDLIGLAG